MTGSELGRLHHLHVAHRASPIAALRKQAAQRDTNAIQPPPIIRIMTYNRSPLRKATHQSTLGYGDKHRLRYNSAQPSFSTVAGTYTVRVGASPVCMYLHACMCIYKYIHTYLCM